MLLTKESFRNALSQCGISKGSTVYVTGNLGRLGPPLSQDGIRLKNKQQILEFYKSTILELIGSTGTLVFPTHSWDLVHRNVVFNGDITPCDYLFSEYLRTTLKCRRQIHPFASIAAHGYHADQIINDQIQLHPYSYLSPFAQLERITSVHLSLGLPVSRTFSAVHYCEFLSGVPYRYTKGFRKKIILDGRTVEKEFFLYVNYQKEGIARDRNVKIFRQLKTPILKSEIGSSYIQSISMNEAIQEIKALMNNDPYIWVRTIEASQEQWSWRK